MVQGVAFVALQRRGPVLVGDEAVPGVVDQRFALIVGRRVSVVVEGQVRRAGGGFFVLLVEGVVDRTAAVGGGATEVAERVERPGDGVGGAADRIVPGVQRAAGEGDELVEVVVAVRRVVGVVECDAP